MFTMMWISKGTVMQISPYISDVVIVRLLLYQLLLILIATTTQASFMNLLKTYDVINPTNIH